MAFRARGRLASPLLRRRRNGKADKKEQQRGEQPPRASAAPSDSMNHWSSRLARQARAGVERLEIASHTTQPNAPMPITGRNITNARPAIGARVSPATI